VIFENRPRPPGRLESCWPTDFREFVTQGLARANQPMVVESWCDVPPETARCRFEARHPRHPVHGDLPTDDEWARWSHTARPLRIGPTLHVDTTGPVDVGAVTARIRAKHPGLTHNRATNAQTTRSTVSRPETAGQRSLPSAPFPRSRLTRSVYTIPRDAIRCRSCRDDSKPSRSYTGTALRPDWTVTRRDPRRVACSEAASTSAEPIPWPRCFGMTKTLWMSADSRLIAPGLGTRGTSATQAMPTISGRRSRATNARCESWWAPHHCASSAANASTDRCAGSSLWVSSHNSRAKSATSSAFA
jgi:hypothetical protein